MGALCRFLLGVFYREVEVVGADRIPRDRPLVIVANHTNGLVDPMLIVGTLAVPARFLAKSTLWRIPVLGSLIDLAGAIPVYRRQDVEKARANAKAKGGPSAGDGGGAPGEDGAEGIARKNDETFARCHEVLAAGGAIALFPEGTSHSQPALKPAKTGAARIVLEAERKLGPLGVRILPLGLFFERKGKFRTRALIQVGDPFGAEAEVALYKEDGAEAVRRLTDRIETALEGVTLNYASWEEARQIARAADLYARPELDVPRGRRLEQTFAIHRAFLEGYPEIRERFPERTAAVAEAVEAYDRLLRTAGVSDAQVASRYAPQPVLRFLGRSLLRLLLHLPLAAVGTLLNIVPYLLVRLIARLAGKAPDQQATFKVLPGLALYPLAWIAETVPVGKWAGAEWGVLALVIAPASGYAAMLFHERRKFVWREVRAFLVLQTRSRLAAELRERRQAVYREVDALVGEYQGRGARPESGKGETQVLNARTDAPS